MIEQKNEATDIASATDNYLNSLDEQSSAELDDQGEQSERNSTSDQEQSAIELDKIEKFKFKNKDYTTKDLERFESLQSEFTKKSQSYAKAQEFAENLHVDLAKVKANPALAEQFKQIYPKHYHALVDLIKAQEARSEQNGQKPSVDPKFLEEFEGIKSEFQQWKEQQYQQQVEAQQAKLMSIEAELTKKYPKADVELVYARMQSLIDTGKIDSKEINKDTWDRVYKDVHDKFDKLTKTEQKSVFDKVKSANLKGSSVGRGGSAPGQAPKNARTISEATDMFLEDLGKR